MSSNQKFHPAHEFGFNGQPGMLVCDNDQGEVKAIYCAERDLVEESMDNEVIVSVALAQAEGQLAVMLDIGIVDDEGMVLFQRNIYNPTTDDCARILGTLVGQGEIEMVFFGLDGEPLGVRSVEVPPNIRADIMEALYESADDELDENAWNKAMDRLDKAGVLDRFGHELAGGWSGGR